MVVKGELTLNSYGIPQVAECGSHRQFQLGVMASSPYFRLLKEYDAISVAGTKPVLVQLSGVPTDSSNSGSDQVLDSPTVISLTGGNCDA